MRFVWIHFRSLNSCSLLTVDDRVYEMTGWSVHRILKPPSVKSLIWWWQCQQFLFFLFRLTLDQQLSWQQTDKQIKLSLFKSFSSFFQYVMVSVCWPLLDLEPRMYGEVKSPQYPKPYPPNLQEQWDLIVPEGFQIRMTFTHLDIEASAGCHYDALTVRVTFKVNNIT